MPTTAETLGGRKKRESQETFCQRKDSLCCGDGHVDGWI